MTDYGVEIDGVRTSDPVTLEILVNKLAERESGLRSRIQALEAENARLTNRLGNIDAVLRPRVGYGGLRGVSALINERDAAEAACDRLQDANNAVAALHAEWAGHSLADRESAFELWSKLGAALAVTPQPTDPPKGTE